jgi:hypothetical protein
MAEIKSFLDSPEMEELRKIYKESQEKYKKEVDSFWESLSYDDKLKAFSYVISKVYDADVVDRGSYRWCLYDKFGFQEDSYMIGMDAKYLELHNIIYDGCDYGEFKFAKKVIINNDYEEILFEFPDSSCLDFSFDKETDTLTIKKEESFSF